MRAGRWVFIAIGLLAAGCAVSTPGFDPTRGDEADGMDALADVPDEATGRDDVEKPPGDGSRDGVEIPSADLDHFRDDGPSDPGGAEVPDRADDGPAGPGGPCLTGEDCAEGLFCDDASGVCVVCRRSADCPVGEFCLDDLCVPWVCVPGSAVCDGSILRTCGQDGEGFVSERDCDDADPCTVGDRCENRHCVAGVPRDCDDGDPCTEDSCEPEVGCLHSPIEGPPCDDLDPCTSGDVCQAAGCLGTPRDCSDGNPCTDDLCDPARGCVHRPNQAWCDDQDLCTGGDRCELGACRGVPVTACDDGDPCTEDRCESGACAHHLIPDCGPCQGDDDCDDGNPCSLDACVTGSCEHVPSPDPGCCVGDEECDDLDGCTTEECVGAPFGTCRRRAVPVPACCTVETFAAGFPGGDAQGFVLDAPRGQVGWNLLDTGFSTSPPWSLYYGNPDALDYSTGESANAGAARSPEVLLPAGVRVTLRFWVWMDVETHEDLDVLAVDALTDVGEFVLWKKPWDLPMKAWREVVIDLSALQAHPVRFRFTFDTRDGHENSGRGVYLDDVRVTSTCKPVSCATDLDCRSVGMVGSCQGGSCDFTEVQAAVLAFGGPGAGPGQLQSPFDVATGPDAAMVADRDNHRVQVFGLDGTVRFSFGTRGSGDGQFQSPHGLALSGDRVYVADTKNHRIQVFSRMGVFLFAFGGQGTDPGRFQEPKDVAMTADGGAAYVADTSNHRIQVFDPEGVFALAFGEYGKKPGQFRSPSCVLPAPDFRVFVCDTQNQRVQVLTWDGGPVASLQATGDLALDSPYGVALRPDGLVVVSDTLHHRLVTFTTEGAPWGVFGAYGTGVGEFRFPMGMAQGANGRLFVADTSNHRVVVVKKTAFP